MLEITRRHVAKCYLATRWHPTLGLLLKVGSSIDPEKRIRDLQAIPCMNLWRPYAHESQIKRHLQRWRAWPEDRTRWITPAFQAPSEWFLWNATSRQVLNAYIALEFAKASTSGTLADLFFLDTEPDPQEDT